MRWQRVYGGTNQTGMSGLPTPKGPQPKPYNSYFAIPIETQSQNPNFHPPPRPAIASTAPRQDYHIALGSCRAKASFEYRIRISQWNENAEKLRATLAVGDNENGLWLTSLNTFRSMFEEKEFKALKQCVTEVEAILQDCDYDRISGFTARRSREQ
jgi:hypothetical protein